MKTWPIAWKHSYISVCMVYKSYFYVLGQTLKRRHLNTYLLVGACITTYRHFSKYLHVCSAERPRDTYLFKRIYLYTLICMHIHTYIYVSSYIIVLAYNNMEATILCANPCKSIYPKMLALRTSSKSPTPTHNSHGKSIISTTAPTPMSAHKYNRKHSHTCICIYAYTHMHHTRAKPTRQLGYATFALAALPPLFLFFFFCVFTHSSTRRRMSDTTPTTSMTRRDNYEYVRWQSQASIFSFVFASSVIMTRPAHTHTLRRQRRPQIDWTLTSHCRRSLPLWTYAITDAFVCAQIHICCYLLAYVCVCVCLYWCAFVFVCHIWQFIVAIHDNLLLPLVAE